MRPPAMRVLFIALAVGLMAGLIALQVMSVLGNTSDVLRIGAAYLISVGVSLIIMSTGQRTGAAANERPIAPLDVPSDSRQPGDADSRDVDQ